MQNTFEQKAAHKMLVKLIVVVNFTNISQVLFTLISLPQKITNPNC
jgi:hypothetical protein